MQYPVIDLISLAYLNNGWTGLDVNYGSNIFYVVNNGNLSISDGVTVNVNPYWGYSDYFIPISNSLISLNADRTMRLTIYEYDDNYNFLGILQPLTSTRISTITLPNNVAFIRFGLNISGTEERFSIDLANTYHIQVNFGNQMEYETAGPPTTDIANRLKLPLPHYFPHPVIDALQRASAGTQTADDTEILRHYLTPLGIGGI